MIIGEIDPHIRQRAAEMVAELMQDTETSARIAAAREITAVAYAARVYELAVDAQRKGQYDALNVRGNSMPVNTDGPEVIAALIHVINEQLR